jgi:hypothetical protein
MDRTKTDFLCEESSFLTGLGSILDLSGHHHQYNSCDEPDETAIRQDWNMVAQALRDVMRREEGNLSRVTHERKQPA